MNGIRPQRSKFESSLITTKTTTDLKIVNIFLASIESIPKAIMVSIHANPIAPFVLLLFSSIIQSSLFTEAFHTPHARTIVTTTILKSQQNPIHNESDNANSHKINHHNTNNIHIQSRRSIITKTLQLSLPILSTTLFPNPSYAAVGSLPEYKDSNAVLQGITLDVSDLNQQNDMIDFLKEGFGLRILRQRKVNSVTETVREILFLIEMKMLE